MTRDKFWEIVTTKLVWVDYWNGQKEPSEEVKEILTNSLLIPKHKFGVGDVVKDKNGSCWNIAEYLYDPNKKEWVYYTMMFRRRFYESELELVEEGK